MERGRPSSKRKRPNEGVKGKKPSKMPKFNEDYYNCGKDGYLASQCKKPKKDKGKQGAHVAENNDDWEDDLYAVVFEVYYVDNPIEWFIETGLLLMFAPRRMHFLPTRLLKEKCFI